MLTNLKITQKGQWVNLYHRLVIITLQSILAAKLSQKFCSGCPVTWFLRKFSGTWPYIGPLFCESLFFFWLQLEVAIELLSGINMLLISMVALKMLIPQQFWNCPKGQSMGRFIPTVTIILQWILCSCHTNSTVDVWPPLFLQKCCETYCESVFFSGCTGGHRVIEWN